MVKLDTYMQMLEALRAIELPTQTDFNAAVKAVRIEFWEKPEYYDALAGKILLLARMVASRGVASRGVASKLFDVAECDKALSKLRTYQRQERGYDGAVYELLKAVELRRALLARSVT